MSRVQRFPPDWDMTDFHQRLRGLCTARKLTQTRMAELLAVSPRVYTRCENGGATPLFGTVVRIADILNVSLVNWQEGRKPAAMPASTTRNSTANTRRSISFQMKTRRR